MSSHRPRWIRIALSGALLASAAFGQETLNSLMQQLNEAYLAKNYDRAIAVSHKLIEQAPKDSTHQYNLACCLSLKGDGAAAKQALAKSVELGFRDATLMESDLDLAAIRDSAEFKAALEGTRKNSAGSLSEIKTKAAAQKPHILTPPNHDPAKPAPLIITLHGYGGSAQEHADLWKKTAAEAGAILLAPQGLNASGAGYQWGSVDEAEVVVLAAMEIASASHKIDPARVVVSGFSQGGMVTYALAQRHPQKFAGAIPVCGTWTKWPSSKGPKFFIMVGGQDSALPNNKSAAESLQKDGYTTNLAIYPGVGHAYPGNRDEELAKALKFVLGS